MYVVKKTYLNYIIIATGYVHGHEFGGTNPLMINALDLNCQIISLNTKFNIEMLENKKVVFFEKNVISV